MTLHSALQVARVPVLVVLLLLVRPVQARLFPAINTLDAEAARWPTLTLVATPIVFMVVVVVARRTRHPPWLLAVEGVIAALLGLILPLWGGWALSGRFSWPPEALAGIAEAFSHAMAVGGALGLGQAANWLVVVLGLAWLVLAADTAVRQARQPHTHGDRAKPMAARRGVAVRSTLPTGRILALLGLLLLSGPAGARWIEAFTTIEYPALRWTWLALAGIALAFLVIAVLGRGPRYSLWLVAGEAVLAGVIAAVWLLPALAGPFLGREGLEVVARLSELATQAGVELNVTETTWFYTPVLAIAWFVVAAETLVRHLRESAPRRDETPERA